MILLIAEMLEAEMLEKALLKIRVCGKQKHVQLLEV